MRAIAAFFLLAFAAVPAPAAAPVAEKLAPTKSELVRGDLRLELVDLTPQFLAFYRAAQGKDGDARFAAWLEHYDFAAVPPGPEGQKIARRLLDGAWERYAAALPGIEGGAKALGDESLDMLARIAALLEVKGALAVRLTAFVGAFDDNAFTSRAGSGMSAVYLPVEMAAERRRILVPHELAHAVHIQLAAIAGGWERSIAATLLMEGIAGHVTRSVAPGLPERDYVEYTSGWWEKAGARRREILAGILPALAAKDPDTVMRYTMGSGTTGLEREAYAAGWWVVEQLLQDGMSLAKIARVAEADMPALARRAIDRLLA